MSEPESQLPPHSMPDECGVLSCCLLSASDCIPECSKVNESCFYDERNKLVWRAIAKLNETNQGVDQISVTRTLNEMGRKEVALEYLTTIIDASPSAHNLPSYLPSLFDYAIKRKMVRSCVELSAMAMNGHTAVEVMAKAETLLSFRHPMAAPMLNGDEAGIALIDDLERRHALNGALSGLATGLGSLDYKTDGLQFGEQTIIGARPSKGKTALGLEIFRYCSLVKGVPALFVSLEMSASALMRRMLSSHCELSMNTIRRGTYNEGDFKKMNAFRLAVKKSPIHILDGVRGMTASEICSQVKRHVRKHSVKLVVVDYLQKVRPDERHEKRTYEVAEVSGRLRGLAVDTGAAFLTLAQLNRESEKEKGRAPRLSDLADSGQVERDADTVILIDRKNNESETRLIVAKQRDGETGVCRSYFNGQYCRFENPQEETTTAPHND